VCVAACDCSSENKGMQTQLCAAHRHMAVCGLCCVPQPGVQRDKIRRVRVTRVVNVYLYTCVLLNLQRGPLEPVS
jgi:hypothetical protein